MGFLLTPVAKEKSLMARFSGLTEKVRSAQASLREQKRQSVRDETVRLREEVRFMKDSEESSDCP